MEKMNGESMNIERENIKRLKEIFPEVFTEDRIDFEKLQLILGEDIEESEERYSFNWNGKRDAIRLSQTPTTGTLRPDKDNSKNWDETENLYIEGDNLEVLKLLQKSYHGKIKMIYIDPPYNTGTDIIYKNDFSDPIKYYKAFTGQIDSEGYDISTNTESDGKFHTNWLNMMYPRLRLARNLLTDDGAICVAIDQNELANLIKIMDEVYGEVNRLGIITVVSKPEGRNQEKFFATSTEYAVYYAKNKKNCKFYPVILDEDVLKTYDRKDKKGKYRLNNYIRTGGGDVNKRENKPNFYYPVYISKDLMRISTKEFDGALIKYPITSHERTWKTKKETLQDRIDNGEILAEYDVNGNVQVYEKYRVEKGQLIKTHWIDKKYNFINNGTKVVESLLGGKFFDYPKSLYYVEDLIKLSTSENDIILDFFSGSSTTAHAVMDLNAEDGGNRKFIMVQLPEPTDEKSEAYKEGYKTIADIGRERIRRAGEKILEENKDKEGIENLDIGFKAFKLDSSNIKEWNPEYMEKDFTMEDLVNNFVPDREKEDILYEIILKYGIDLTTPIEQHKVEDKTIYNIGFGSLFVCLENDIDEKIVDKILKLNEEYKMPNPMVVFKDIGFKNDEIKLNAKLSLNDNGIEEVVSI